MHHFSMVATFKTKPLGSYKAKKLFYYYGLQPSLSNFARKFKREIRVFSIVVPYVAKFTSL